MIVNYLDLVIAMILGTSVAVVMLVLWMRANSQTAIALRTLIHEAEGSMTFLFDDHRLVDATPQARALMGHKNPKLSDWENFVQLLSARFPHLRSQVKDLAEVGKKTIRPEYGQPGWIEAEFWNGLARLTLIKDQAHPDQTIDPLTAVAIEHELETLRAIGEDSPQLIWKRDAEGVLVWANRAYIELSEVIHGSPDYKIRPWPPKEVFENVVNPAGSAPVIDMHQIHLPDQDNSVWYEITSLRRGGDSIHFAVDSSAIVAAREAQRDFVQTLTKTFAQLSVGLSIFDANRRLVLFNPAMLDLTNLPPDFLIGRPTLLAFLDRLRDNQMMPEPKDYASWRNQIAELEAEAKKGSYHETWLLPNGQTYRVTGKPHPNGAIAFLMEDISDEISLTRKFRSQIDISAAVIDNLPSAVAVFSSSGSMIMSNVAYQALWGTQVDGTLANRDLVEELELWKTVSAPSPAWIKLEASVARQHSQTAWTETIWLDGDEQLIFQYAPLPNGNHQIMFSSIDADTSFADQGLTEKISHPAE